MLDVSMPLLDGFDVQRELKRLGLKLPVILMSGVPSQVAKVRAETADVLADFSKPFDEDEFLFTIKGDQK
ncbi:response regulator [Rhizobium halophilum]|uniref:response regulator n=1 Tax=Rhizobium halophilum TaxID=2846852 RepID=UPI001EFCED19|nr:response regulator [Rhizobium halophilum]MCF6371344.1 response regulator [Rhizobium halophilum]